MIEFEYNTPKGPEQAVKDLYPGAVFSGTINGNEGPWLRTYFSIVNLREIGKTISDENRAFAAVVTNYHEHKNPKLILD